jgi:hypothetical protein
LGKQDQSNPLLNYTIPARLIIIAALLGSPIGVAIAGRCIYDELPSGSYPILFSAFPVMFFFVLIGFRLLRYFGVPVYTCDVEKEPGSRDASKEPDQEV